MSGLKIVWELLVNDLVIVMCPPYPEYKEAPADHTHSELFDCPKCKSKMWLSEKKKGIIMFSSCVNKNILLACYDCITKMAWKDSEFFADHKMVKL